MVAIPEIFDKELGRAVLIARNDLKTVKRRKQPVALSFEIGFFARPVEKERAPPLLPTSTSDPIGFRSAEITACDVLPIANLLHPLNIHPAPPAPTATRPR